MTTLKPLPETIINYNKQSAHAGEFELKTLARIKLGETPISPGQFIATDKDGKPLEKPDSLKGFYETHIEGMAEEKILREEYLQAEQKVLFNGWEVRTKLTHTVWIGINDIVIVFPPTSPPYIEVYNESSEDWDMQPVETIESIAHLNLELVDGKEKVL